MTLSPEEKERIYEEEKVRLEAEEKAKKELMAKRTKTGCLALIGFTLVIALIASLCVALGGETETIDLEASVRFTGTQFEITNHDYFDWTNVKLTLNDDFEVRTTRMEAGETYTVGAMQFAKGDGTMFNPLTHKPRTFSIWCDTPDGHGWWYGGWE